MAGVDSGSMPGPDGDAILDALATNVVDTRFSDLDDGTVENAKRRILDAIGCVIGGTGADDMPAVLDLVEAWGGPAEATVLGAGFAAPLPSAAWANCLLGRSFDRGPLTLHVEGQRFPSHVSETTVPTALAVAEAEDVSGPELIAALVAADDLAARIWTARGDMPPPDEWDEFGPTFDQWGTVTTFGAAAVAGRLLGLDADGVRDALGIAINLMSGGGAGLWDGSPVFKLAQGTSGRAGVVAAQLAEAGWVGVDDPLFGERGGYFPLFEGGCDRPDRLTDGLGETFHVEDVFKPYPGGRPTHAPIDAALELAPEGGFDVAGLSSVVLRTSPPATAAHYSKPYRLGEYPTGHALFSYKYAVASALLRGRAGNAEYTESAIRSPDVQAVIDRVHLEGLDRERGVELAVETAGDATRSTYVPVALGEPENPLSWGDLASKFREQVEFAGTVAWDDAGTVIDRVGTLEEQSSVAHVLVPAAGDR